MREASASEVRTVSTIERAESALVGVVKTTSALRAASWKAGGTWASTETTGWPWGGLGVIEGPFTENHRPSKSM